MSRASSPHDSPCPLFRLSAELARARTVDAAVAHTIELAEAALDHPIVSVHEFDPADGTTTVVDSSANRPTLVTDHPAWPPEAMVNALGGRRSDAAPTPQATLAADPRDPLRAELLVPVGRAHLLAVGTTDRDGFDDAAVTVAEGLAATLETALDRIDRRRPPAVDDLVGASFDQSDEAAFVSAPDGTLVAVNRAALELTGREREELLGSDLSVLCRAGATEAVCEHLDRAATGASEPCRATVCRADSEERSVEFVSHPVETNGSTYVHTTARVLSTPSGDGSGPGGDTAETDATALRRLNELTVDPEGFDETVEQVLSLGRDYLGLDTAILSRVEGSDYEVKAVVDATETHETGAVYDLADTMCAATLAGSTTEILAFSDIADSAHRDHPAAEAVRSYIAAPVVVDGEPYGTVNFSMATPREEAFRPEERAFITLVAQWIGTEIERRRRFEELERYETILEAVNDPVYALDPDGRFTFVNAAAQAAFGYGPEIIGEHPSIGMADSDVGRIREQIADLIETDRRSTTAEFDFETADGGRRTVENTLALIGDDEFRGTAGIVRDVTDRNRRRRQLESFQEAIDEAADGVAILDDGEFVYVDQTHTEVYGFEEKAQLLGDSWRTLYDDAEVERLEAEAFPALETDGYWRGQVTGRRQDGSMFPSEISLTAIEDGRIVCVIRDETERQRRERELESFQRAIESARDGVAILDDGEYTYVDATHVEMYGFENKAQLLGDSWRKLYDDAEVERLEAEAFPALETDGYWRGRVTGSRPDGSTFPAELSLTIVDGGRLVCTVRDETERRARERELELKERAMDEASVGIQITDPTQEKNPLVYVNDGFERITGYDREEVLGRNPRFLQHEETGTEQRTRLRDAIDAEEPVSVELQNRREDGTIYWSRLSVTPVTDETGTLRNFIGIQQDITERKRRERELFEERERLQLLTESVDEYAFFIVGPDGDIQTWNESAESTFGYDPEAVLGTPTSTFYPAADNDRGLPERLLQQARVAGKSAHDGWLVSADGSEFYADVQYASLTDDDGEFRGYAAVVRDMTERRRQRRRTERFLEESIDVVTVVDPDGEITYASGSADRVLGHDPDGLAGENLFDWFHTDSREEVMEAFFDSRDHTNADVRIEGRFESGDGEWLNVRGQCRNLLNDDAVDGMLVSLRDVTDERERARRFESIFNQTYQFTGLLRPDGTVVEINNAALEFGGTERDDTVGDQFADLSWWTHSETTSDEIRDALDRAASGEFVRYETTVRGADGLATIDFSVKPVTDTDGSVSLLVVEGRDITTQKQHRRHLEVMQRVVRHNMRNDLTKLRGWAGLMCAEDDAETRAEQFARLESVLDKWEAMSEKMKQIRTLFESETRLRSSADPESILEDAVAPVRDEGADVAVVIDAPDTASVRVPPALRDAVRELVDNATDATEHGVVEVDLTRPDDDWVEITVSDDGPGLPEMEADVLATGEETPLNHGQGLGLWMVRMIVTQAGGDVSVDTAADGTTVCLRLPTDRSDETNTPSPTV